VASQGATTDQAKYSFCIPTDRHLSYGADSRRRCSQRPSWRCRYVAPVTIGQTFYVGLEGLQQVASRPPRPSWPACTATGAASNDESSGDGREPFSQRLELFAMQAAEQPARAHRATRRDAGVTASGAAAARDGTVISRRYQYERAGFTTGLASGQPSPSSRGGPSPRCRAS